MSGRRRVAITGLGAISPFGNSVAETWEGVREGRSCIRPLANFDASGLTVRFGGEVRDFDIGDHLPRRQARGLSLFAQYGLAAGVQAAADAGLRIAESESHRVGVAIGSGIGGLENIEKTVARYLEAGQRKISPYYVPGNIINMVSGSLAIFLGARGSNFSLVSACATGAHNIGISARLIQSGEADAMLAGGCEMATCPTGVGGFASARALSTRNDAPAAASRPWDRDRDGFVIGDGAGVVVLEEYQRARRRGANIYAELAGYGTSADAYHMTSPLPDGAGMFHCMRQALEDAGLAPERVGYINAHATSTSLGDPIESKAIERLFGDHAFRLAVSSTKSMTGHMLGAAGGIESIVSVLALQQGVVPPTINLENAAPDCRLDYVPGAARKLKYDVAMSNSFGFGGTNVSLVFRRPH
ncbi:MAG: beta-ketoacyl-ACP synthase II [Gammaproteobacteria bacterium]|nr:beta-ketoacyl-ACP synthase II [Gammaproteobacteria bacterium]MDD9823845.1 beta-ketoacyl-ACP synthase II [Gammaproteobacteria bacterium]MDD9863288.1 beta-ketoacyl-ACP synthase II [Gammaproteobacteria bacterium]